MSLKRLVVDENNFLRANTLNDMKTNATFHVGDVVEVAENYTFYKINSANATGGIAVANNLFAVPVKKPAINYSEIVGTPTPPDLSIYMPLAGNHTKSGNLTITGSCNADTVTATGNITAYSDRKTKADIKVLSQSLEKLKYLTGYEYLMITSDEKSMGFMADEVEKVFPTAVISDDNGIKKVAYIQLIAPIVEAVKELEKRIRKLEEVV